MLKKIILTAAAAGSLFSYNMVNVNFNSSDLEVGATTAKKTSASTTAFYTLSYLGVEDEWENKHTSIYGDMLLSGKQNKTFNFGLGIRAQYMNLDSETVDDYICFPLRGKLYLTLPVPSVTTVLSAEMAYAPEVLMISDDFISSRETRFELNGEVVSNGFVYFGFRTLTLEPDGGGDNIDLNDNSSYFGLKMEF